MARVIHHTHEVQPVSPLTFLARLIWFIASVVISLLALRFILALLGANPANGFVNLIYDASHPLVAPFFNMFHYNVMGNGISQVEIYTLVAMLIYALLASGITYLLTFGRRE